VFNQINSLRTARQPVAVSDIPAALPNGASCCLQQRAASCSLGLYGAIGYNAAK